MAINGSNGVVQIHYVISTGVDGTLGTIGDTDEVLLMLIGVACRKNQLV